MPTHHRVAWAKRMAGDGTYIIAPTSLRRRYESLAALRGSIVLHIHFKGLLIPVIQEEAVHYKAPAGRVMINCWYFWRCSGHGCLTVMFISGPCRDGTVHAPTKARAIKTEVWSKFHGREWKWSHASFSKVLCNMKMWLGLKEWCKWYLPFN